MRLVAMAALFALVPVVAGCAAAPEPPAEVDTFEQDLGHDLEATATTGVIRGIVVDATVVPIPDAFVRIESLGINTTTNAHGAFGFQDLEPGTYVVHAVRFGYIDQTAIASVVAGVDRPEIVKLVLAADVEQVVYTVPYRYDGFMECGNPAVEVCTVPNQIGRLAGIGNVTDDTTVFQLRTDRAPDWLQAELSWDGSQPLADYFSFCFQHPGQTNPPPDPNPADPVGTAINTAAWLLFGSGASAEWIRCGLSKSPVVIAVDRNVSLERHVSPLVHMQVYGGHSDDVPDPTGIGLNTLVGFQFQQDFEVFAHAFYNTLPAAGWVFVHDGPPEGA